MNFSDPIYILIILNLTSFIIIIGVYNLLSMLGISQKIWIYDERSI